MAADRLTEFMAAIRLIESGSKAGNYLQTSAGGRIVGAYGISIENWRRWTTELNLDGARWTDKAAQDSVARAKFGELYSRYRDWRLVAAAWFGGSDAAALAQEQGIEALASSLVSDINRVTQTMGGRLSELDPADVGKVSRAQDTAARNTAAAELAQLPQGGGGRIGGGITYVDVPVVGVIGQSRQEQGRPEPDPATMARLRSSQMHRNVSAMLQGLSNAIRRGASGLAEAQSVLTPSQEAAIETGEMEEEA